MKSVITPEVDMLTVSKSCRSERKSILGVIPKIGLKLDYGELDRIDCFYLECQNSRDYFRDPYNKLQRPQTFRTHQGKCGITLDRSVDLLRLPPNSVVEHQPVVYPIEYGHHMNLDGGKQMFGQYNPSSCIKFKR